MGQEITPDLIVFMILTPKIFSFNREKFAGFFAS